jgi:L-threonylcarbamoyladenylate synthase
MLLRDDVVAFPTETVYGLGASVFSEQGLIKIFEIKQRPFFDPLIVHVSSFDDFDRIVDFSAMTAAARRNFRLLTETPVRPFMPGPLTLVLPKRGDISAIVSSGMPTIAVRFPSNEAAQKLITLAGVPIAAPSANPFGYLSPTRAEHVVAQIGDACSVVLDGGPCTIGVESTVLDLTVDPPVILRHGGTAEEDLRAALGALGEKPDDETAAMSSPGLLTRHYAPRTKLVLLAEGELIKLYEKAAESANGALMQDAAFLFFKAPGRDELKNLPSSELERRTFFLTAENSVQEAALRLFDTLHWLDTQCFTTIYAEAAPDYGLGRAINDRLGRASAG